MFLSIGVDNVRIFRYEYLFSILIIWYIRREIFTYNILSTFKKLCIIKKLQSYFVYMYYLYDVAMNCSWPMHTTLLTCCINATVEHDIADLAWLHRLVLFVSVYYVAQEKNIKMAITKWIKSLLVYFNIIVITK